MRATRATRANSTVGEGRLHYIQPLFSSGCDREHALPAHTQTPPVSWRRAAEQECSSFTTVWLFEHCPAIAPETTSDEVLRGITLTPNTPKSGNPGPHFLLLLVIQRWLSVFYTVGATLGIMAPFDLLDLYIHSSIVLLCSLLCIFPV